MLIDFDRLLSMRTHPLRSAGSTADWVQLHWQRFVRSEVFFRENAALATVCGGLPRDLNPQAWTGDPTSRRTWVIRARNACGARARGADGSCSSPAGQVPVPENRARRGAHAQRGARRGARRPAPRRAGRVHERLLRPAPRRPRAQPRAGDEPRRSAGRGRQPRRLGAAPQGPRAPDRAGAPARRADRRARMRRLGGAVRRTDPARADPQRCVPTCSRRAATGGAARSSGARTWRAGAGAWSGCAWCPGSAARSSSSARGAPDVGPRRVPAPARRPARGAARGRARARYRRRARAAARARARGPVAARRRPRSRCCRASIRARSPTPRCAGASKMRSSASRPCAGSSSGGLIRAARATSSGVFRLVSAMPSGSTARRSSPSR